MNEDRRNLTILYMLIKYADHEAPKDVLNVEGRSSLWWYTLKARSPGYLHSIGMRPWSKFEDGSILWLFPAEWNVPKHLKLYQIGLPKEKPTLVKDKDNLPKSRQLGLKTYGIKVKDDFNYVLLEDFYISLLNQLIKEVKDLSSKELTLKIMALLYK